METEITEAIQEAKANDPIRQEYERLTALMGDDDDAFDASTAPPPPEPPLAPIEGARRLKEMAPAAYLFRAAVGHLGPQFDIDSYYTYLAAFVAANGSPTDPIEVMMLEQLAMAHNVIGLFHARAGAHQDPVVVQGFNASAAKMMAEFRRTALAVKALRSPRPSDAEHAAQKPAANKSHRKEKKSTVSMATNGHAADGKKTHSETELGSKNRLEGYFDATNGKAKEESERVLT